jgi:hypothetical protein
MLAQAKSNTLMPGVSVRADRNEVVWAAIESLLRREASASTRRIADALGMSPATAQARLAALRELGDVRHAAARAGVRGRVWELGAGESIAAAEMMGPRIVKAVHTGACARDPLVAALFGPAARASAALQASGG